MQNNPSGPSGSQGDSSANLMTEQVKQQTQQAARQTQQVASQATSQIQQQARSMATSRKDQAAQTLEQAAEALRQTGQQLQEQNQGAVGQLADKAASQVESVSTYLRNHDVDQLITEAENIARRNRAMFLGGSFVLGVLATRFLKSSQQSQDSSAQFSNGTQQGYYQQPYAGSYQGSSMSPSVSYGYEYEELRDISSPDPNYTAQTGLGDGTPS